MIESESKRLFIGISLSDALAQACVATMDALRDKPGFEKACWTQRVNLHVTVKFIGAFEAKKLQALIESVCTVCESEDSFSLEATGLSTFPVLGDPRCLVANIRPKPALSALVAAIEESLFQLGVAREERLYHSHITLCRDFHVEPALVLPEPALPEMEVDKVTLFESKKGAAYLALETFNLCG